MTLGVIFVADLGHPYLYIIVVTQQVEEGLQACLGSVTEAPGNSCISLPSSQFLPYPTDAAYTYKDSPCVYNIRPTRRKTRMPPHLHPRSRTTSSLFVTTLVASFVVVGLPHILPCPRPATRMMDGELSVDEKGRPRRRRRKTSPQFEAAGNSEPRIVQFEVDREDAGPSSTRRECPILKPGGIIGDILGFNSREPKTRGSDLPQDSSSEAGRGDR